MTGVNLLEALGAAVDAARADRRAAEQPTEPSWAPCPDCNGSGVHARRAYGHFEPEPFVWETCVGCSGTGAVAAEAVAFCPSCGVAVWVDQVCEHQVEPSCVEHSECRGACAGDRSDR